MAKTIYKCSVCGYIYKDAKVPKECPYCHNADKVFYEVNEKMVDFEFFLDAWQKQVRWMNNTKYQYKIKLNEDENILKTLAEEEGKNLLTKGQAYCPCRMLENKAEPDRKVICPCVFYMGEVELQGHCHCHLYIREDLSVKNKK